MGKTQFYENMKYKIINIQNIKMYKYYTLHYIIGIDVLYLHVLWTVCEKSLKAIANG